MANKGSPFEREVCKQLSLWWTGGESDAVFWRTSQSGGRATTRRQKGKSTFGQQGDVAATDPIGLPLVRLATIELKRGYRDANLGDLLDVTVRWSEDGDPVARPLENFFAQAERERVGEGTPFWLLIHRRDHRQAVAYVPVALYEELQHAGSSIARARPLALFTTHMGVKVVAFSLDHFLARVTRAQVESLHREFR